MLCISYIGYDAGYGDVGHENKDFLLYWYLAECMYSATPKKGSDEMRVNTKQCCRYLRKISRRIYFGIF